MESNNNANNLSKENNNINLNINENEEQFHSEKYKKKTDCPNFLLKLYQILENDEYKDIIHWSEDGKYFIVKNLHDFTENILPKYYKHNNYSSFIRQLNMYDFHKKKSSPNEHIFEHKNFIKNKKELLKLIKRKTKKDNNNNNAYNNDYNNILIHYPNYTPYITNKLLPSKEADIISNIPNNNENKIIYNNNFGNNSFSLDDNLSANNSIHSLFQYKKTPPLLAMAPASQPQTNNNNNYNYNNINNQFINNNYNNNFKSINLNNEIKEDKKITKKNLQNLLSYLMQSIQENTKTEKQLELKIERLTNQNNEFMIQNKKMLEEIISKNDYNKKLEAVICFILEMIMSKSKMKNNPELKNLFLSNEPNNQFHDGSPNLNKLGLVNFNGPKHEINGIIQNDFLPNNNGAILEPFQSFLNKYYERSKNTGLLTNKEINMNNKEIAKYNNNLLLDEDKYYYPINDPNLNAKILRKNLIGDKNEDNYKNNYQISPYMIHNKRKRSSSFNSILSNLSKGSNFVYNNNKLLPEEEINQNKEEKINDINDKIFEDKKEEKNDGISSNIIFSRKDSISSWNDGKNVFDIDLNQDENKSYLSGWNKDILNNSQSSINDIYNNNSNINKDNDILSDINDTK